jgi:hypothetical protein
MDTNPYAAPLAMLPESVDGPASLGELVRAWEKLRLYFNSILAIPGLGVLALLVSRHQLPSGGAVAGGLFVAIAANVAFFLGPLTELYLRGFLRNGQSLGRGRWLIFGAGMIFSLGLFAAIAVLASLETPP